ncbi:MAG: hypothetical protein AAGA97_03350 [Pseudomonadota bacterium]
MPSVGYKKDLPLKVSGLKLIKAPKVTIDFEVELDKRAEKDKDNQVLIAKIYEAINKKVDALAKDIDKKCVEFDKYFVTLSKSGISKAAFEKEIKQFDKDIGGLISKGEKEAVKQVEKVWTEYCKSRNEWKKFKFKTKVNIVSSGATALVSLGLMVTGPFTGGASFAASIVGLCKSAITIFNESKKLNTSIETDKKKLVRHLTFCKSAYENVATQTANEVSAAIFNEFLSASQPSVKTCQATHKLLKAKHSKMIGAVGNLSSTIPQIMEDQKKLRKEFVAHVKYRIEKHPTPDKKAQQKKIENALDKHMDPHYRMLEKAMEDVAKAHKECEVWKNEIDTLGKAVADLSIKDPVALKTFREALKLAALSQAALNGNKLISSAKDAAAGLAAAGGGYVYDKLKSKVLDGTVLDAA